MGDYFAGKPVAGDKGRALQLAVRLGIAEGNDPAHYHVRLQARDENNERDYEMNDHGTYWTLVETRWRNSYGDSKTYYVKVIDRTNREGKTLKTPAIEVFELMETSETEKEPFNWSDAWRD